MTGAEARQAAPDEGWFELTADMEPYEQFRFIARHVLRSALRETARYAADERIFQRASDREGLVAHLKELDRSLREDESLSPIEAAFLCAAVGAAMEGVDIEPLCLADIIRQLGCSNGDGPRSSSR